MQVRSWVGERSEEGTVTHSIFLLGESYGTEESGGLQGMGSQRSGQPATEHACAASSLHFMFHLLIWLCWVSAVANAALLFLLLLRHTDS